MQQCYEIDYIQEYYNYLNVKDVSSNAKAIVELFQFFMTEHRHVIKRDKNTRKYFNNNSVNIPSVPNINIENHRSKSKLFQIQQRNNISNMSNNNNDLQYR